MTTTDTDDSNLFFEYGGYKIPKSDYCALHWHRIKGCLRYFETNRGLYHLSETSRLVTALCVANKMCNFDRFSLPYNLGWLNPIARWLFKRLGRKIFHRYRTANYLVGIKQAKLKQKNIKTFNRVVNTLHNLHQVYRLVRVISKYDGELLNRMIEREKEISFKERNLQCQPALDQAEVNRA